MNARAKAKTNAKLKVEAKVKGNDMTIDNPPVGRQGEVKGKSGDDGNAEGGGKSE